MWITKFRSAVRPGLVAVMVAGALMFGGPVQADECTWEPVPEDTLRRYEGELLQLLNGARSANGVAPIKVDGRIAQIARDHARRMAADHAHYHNQSYLGHPSRVGARSVGEVVGRGACSPRQAHDALMGSSGHRTTMMRGIYTVGGIGIASDESGFLYFVEAFAEPETQPQQAPAPAPAAAPAPDPDPGVAAAAAPAPAPAQGTASQKGSTKPARGTAEPAAAAAGQAEPEPEPEDLVVSAAPAEFGMLSNPDGMQPSGAGVERDALFVEAAASAAAAVALLAVVAGRIRRRLLSRSLPAGLTINGRGVR